MFFIRLITKLYVKVDILLTYVIHLNDIIVPLEGVELVQKTNLTSPFFSEVPSFSQESGRSFISFL